METPIVDQPLDVDKLAKIYTDLLKTPVISYAKITSSDSNVLNVYSEWSLDDITKKDRTTISKTYTILKSSLTNGEPIVYASSPAPINRKLTCFSGSGLKKAVVVAGKESPSSGNASEAPGEFLQIYDESTLVKTYDLKEMDLHKGIYASGFGRTIAWNQDETKLMYLAEKKIPKAKPFFTSYGEKVEKESDKPQNETKKGENEGKGEEYAFRQSWGEQLADCREAVIVFLDLSTDKFNVVELPDKAFPSDLQWRDNETVIGVGLTDSQWRMGLIFCSNRESRIFQIGSDGTNYKYLNDPGVASSSPRVQPGGKYLVWQEREVLGPHQRSRKIIGFQLSEGSTPVTIYNQAPENGIPIYDNFPMNCWSLDGSKLFTVTSNDIDSVLLAFSFEVGNPSSEPKVMRRVSGILSVEIDYMLAYTSRTAEPQHLILIDNEISKIYFLTPSEPVIPIPLTYHSLSGRASPNSFYYGPFSDFAKPNSIPLIVNIHGGPHAVILNEFSVEMSVLLKLGFGVLYINFFGSTGGTKDVTEDLLGHIGDADVKDCQEILQKLLAQENTIDKEKIAIFGGSHSGFLGAHLTSQFPDTYKAAVLRNPVTDVLALTSVSDITDWAFEEAGVSMDNNITPVIQNLDDAKKFMDCSPIRNVQHVKAATLLLLGSEDLRVPMSQGFAYYRALKAANKVTDVRLYPDNHSLRKVPVRFDHFMHSLIWFFTYITKAAK